MENINVVYVDNSFDPLLERYLDNYCKDYQGASLTYIEVPFDSSDGYMNLLSKDEIKHANIIFIDSFLFENDSVEGQKFTGEEMQLVIKKHFPYIETVLITQNELDDKIEHIRKYKSGKDARPYDEYYKDIIPKVIEKSIRNVITYRESIKRFIDNPAWEEILKEKLSNSLEGNDEYSEMTKEDIDEVARLLRGIQEKYDI